MAVGGINTIQVYALIDRYVMQFSPERTDLMSRPLLQERNLSWFPLSKPSLRRLKVKVNLATSLELDTTGKCNTLTANYIPVSPR